MSRRIRKIFKGMGCVALLGFTFSLSAGCADMIKMAKGYVGGFASMAMGRGDLVQQPDANAQNLNNNLNLAGGQYGGMVGVGWQLSSLHCLAIEAFGFGGKSKGAIQPVSGPTDSVHMNDGFGCNLCLGQKMGKLMGFLKIGYVNSQWTMQRQLAILSSAPLSVGKRLSGFSFGFGGDYDLGCGFALGASWMYSLYQNMQGVVSGTPDATHPLWTLSPRHSMTSLYLRYNF